MYTYYDNLTLQLKKLRHRDIKELTQAQVEVSTVSAVWIQAVLLTITPCCLSI